MTLQKQLIMTRLFYQGHYLPYGLTPYYILAEITTVFSRGAGRRLNVNFLTHLFFQGRYLPRDLVAQYYQRSLFKLQDLLPCFVYYQGHYSHLALH